MLLNDQGLKIAAFEPVLAEALGRGGGEEGCQVVAETVVHGRSRVELRDWAYCLARASGSLLRKRLIDAPGKTPERFVSAIEGAYDEEEGVGLPPDQLTARVVAPEVLRMLDRAEAITREYGLTRVSEPALTLALLEAADEELTYLLGVWAGEEGLRAFTARLRAELGPARGFDLFPGGKLNFPAFAPSGRKLLQRLAEEVASLGGRKVTSRHLLYTLLGNTDGPLAIALSIRGVDVKRDLHSLLARELSRPGARRADTFALSPDTLFEGVVAVLEHSFALATERDAAEIAEIDLVRAFLAKQGRELARLFPADAPLDLASLRDYLDSFEPDEEENAGPLRRFSIREIQENINRKIFGQEAAVARVIPWIKRLRFGLPRDGRPAGVFLFLGPTGAGKTQLAKELARYVFGDEEMMIFLEMGQFKSKESMNMFIGSPPGYVGYGEGKLTNGLRDKPESVVLFDEIEKADSQVFDTLLRFADEGMISDPAGPVRDGRRCIIVLTTNAGQRWLRSHLSINPQARERPEELAQQLFEEAMKELQVSGFRPEFLGRVDERISFLPFTLPVCRQIVDSIVDREIDKFRSLKEIRLEVTDAARRILAQRVLDRSIDEGARGAPRAVNECIITPAIDLLSEEEGDDGRHPTHLIADRTGLDQIQVEIVR